MRRLPESCENSIRIIFPVWDCKWPRQKLAFKHTTELPKTTKQKPIKTPTLFTIRDIEKHFDNPAAQAEYLYSLIDCEVD